MYNSDINLRFIIDRSSQESEETFDEPWAHKFPNQKASSQLVRIYYGAVPVEKIYCVWVDGSRHLIPMPKSQEDLTITPLEYKIGSILNQTLGTPGFDYALDRAGITVTKQESEETFHVPRVPIRRSYDPLSY
jgi:hypothetical protein